MYERPSCCDAVKKSGVYWMPSWYDGPDKDGWTISCEKNYYYPMWINITYCPHCGVKLKPLKPLESKDK